MEIDREREFPVVELDALKSSCGILRSDRIKNEVMKRKMKICETVEGKIQRRQLIWYGHVRRTEHQEWLRSTRQLVKRKEEDQEHRLMKQGTQWKKRRIEKEYSLDRSMWRKELENGRRRQTRRNLDG